MLAGGTVPFSTAELIVRAPDGDTQRLTAPVSEIRQWAAGQSEAVARTLAHHVEQLCAARPSLLGLALTTPRIMGIVNVTPDSFSDGGLHEDTEAAVRHARALMVAGAEIIDIGGESTRPGSEPVAAKTEAERVIPVIRALAAEAAPISIDTRNAVVMQAALKAGARMVNDVSALRHDPDSIPLLAAQDVPVVLMHSQGDPRTMQRDPRYNDVLLDVYDALRDRIEACMSAGIARDRLIVDPGIGFGKTTAHNLALLRGLSLFHGLGCPLLIGVSRKGFISKLSRDEPTTARVPGSLAAALWAAQQGAQLFRVHDVAETQQALSMWRALTDCKT